MTIFSIKTCKYFGLVECGLSGVSRFLWSLSDALLKGCKTSLSCLQGYALLMPPFQFLMRPSLTSQISVLMALLLVSTSLGQSYYKGPALFSKRPDATKSLTSLTGFGPVGMSLDLIKPNFTIRINSTLPGSPAAEAGLQPGMIIESINGEKLADIDPRIQLGNMITKAEAKDGKMVMKVADKPGGATKELTVQLQPLGSYSPTWPLSCPKSDKIVRNYADYLKKEGSVQGFGSLGMLFLLSTGDESDLDHVRKWARNKPKTMGEGFHTWNAGYGNLALAEYYLRTGDKEVLPAIQAAVNNALRAENNGGWGNRAPMTSLTYGGGGGHLNAGSVPLLTFLLLAKECGATMPDEKLHRVLRHYYRWAGRGNVSYGNGKPEGGYTDNGKNGKLAFAMAAAASLSPKKDKSIYARASETTAQFSFYSTSFMLHGHTGGGIGEIWRSASMGLMNEKLPGHYRSFMDERRWHYEMSRRFDGSFNILGGERYDNNSWGAGYALTYTVPRKTLRMTGAPPSKHSVAYDLPERLWGTAADEDFVKFTAIPYADGSLPDFSKETLPTGAGIALLNKAKSELSDDELRMYLRHPQLTARTYFLAAVAQRELPFVQEMLASKDARLRLLGLLAVIKTPEKFLKPETIEIAAKMLANDEESWFVKISALDLMGKAGADVVADHVDLIVPYLQHEEWWLQHSALNSLGSVVADKRVYKKVLPAIGELLKTNHTYNVTAPLRWGPLPENLRNAEPEVAAVAREALKGAYSNYINFEHDLDAVEKRINPGMRNDIATFITKVPGGYDLLYAVTKQRNPNAALPYEKLFLEADPTKFSPDLKEALGEVIEKRLIPRYIASHRKLLLSERANDAFKGGFYYREPRVFGLVGLYQQLGIHDYDWKDFGPNANEMKWHYHSFDPPEKQPWDDPKTRYRKVTLPKGMEEWFQPGFDPAKNGWKQGLQPFGATNGKMVGATIDGSRTSTKPSGCPYDFCRHHLPMKTLWDKEVLMLRGKFTFPGMKDGNRYRLLMGGMSHVGAGEGYKVYVNGRPFMERPRGVGRREGGKAVGKQIDKSWWPEFSGKEVDIAVISFMNEHKGIKSRHMSLWVQEMKLPDLSDEVMVSSATQLPMTSSAWQALQDPDDNDKDPQVGKYTWDGQFAPNEAIAGAWKTIGVTKEPGTFDPKARPDMRNLRLKGIEFKAEGKTQELLWIYTGNLLLDLGSNQALEIQHKTIGGTEYLFIEQGGFNAKNGMDWRPNWEVMTRAD